MKLKFSKLNDGAYLNLVTPTKHTFGTLTNRAFSLLVLFLLTLVATPSAKAEQWVSIGMGKLIDGWIIGADAEKHPLDVEIQKDIDDANGCRYRVWKPYANIEEYISAKNNSAYKELGQIIFDVSDPKYVLVEFKGTNQLDAFWYAGINLGSAVNGLSKGSEYICTNGLGYALGSSNLNLAEAKYVLGIMGYGNTTFNKDAREVIVEKAYLTTPNASSFGWGTARYPAKIILPEEAEPSNWTFNCDFDAIDFFADFGDDKGEIPMSLKYDKKKHCYQIDNFSLDAILSGKIKDEYKNYIFTEIKENSNGNVIDILEESKSFKIVQTDYPGQDEFNISISSTSPSISFITKSRGITDNSDYADITYIEKSTSAQINFSCYTSAIPENTLYEIKYWKDGDLSVLTDEVFDPNSISLALENLQPETAYTYKAQVIAYSSDLQTFSTPVTHDIIAQSGIMTLTFKTGKTFDSSTVNAYDYMWTWKDVPENVFALFAFENIVRDEDNPHIDLSALGGPWNIPGRRIRKEDGVYELTMFYSALLDDFRRQKFLLGKSNEINGKILRFYYPNAEGNLPEGNDKCGVMLENGKKYELIEYNEQIDPTFDYSYEEGFRYFYVGEEKDHLYTGAKLINKQIYNVLVKVEFEDDSFDKPKYITFIYEDEPINDGKPVLVGTLAQTSEIYKQVMESSNPDLYGGWHTYVPLESTNGGYPYTYTFKTNEGDTEYDLALFLNVERPEEIPDYGDALYEDSGQVYPYLSFWSDEYSRSIGLPYAYIPEDGDNFVNLNYTRGVTKPFPASIGASAEYPLTDGIRKGAASIHLKGLEPDKIYKLTVNNPTIIYFDNPLNDSDSRPYLFADVLSWISLMEYEPEVVSYQLVEHFGEKYSSYPNTKVYYTFDLNKYHTDDTKISDTYRIVINDQNTILDCTTVTNINETETYKNKEYLFTDLLLVRTQDPSWLNQNEVDARIGDISGEFVVNDNSETSIPIKAYKPTRKYSYRSLPIYREGSVVGMRFIDNKQSGEIDFAYAIFPMKGENEPLNRQKFTLNDGFTYDFSSNIEFQYYNQFNNVLTTLVDVAPTRVGDLENFINPAVDGYGQLVVSEPKDVQDGIEYSLTAERAVESSTGDNTIKIYFYADDLVNAGYTEASYTLPELKLYAHDYHVKFPYEPSNVTEDLATIMKEQNVLFQLQVDEPDRDGKPYTTVELDPTADTTKPGFFNADLGDIFNVDQNKGEDATRSMTLAKYNFTNVYKRWDNDEQSLVKLDLNAPELTEKGIDYNEDTYDAESNQTEVTHVYLEDVDIDGIGTVRAVCIPGFDLINTLDGITADNDGDLTVGDDDDNFTTLYLVEYDDLYRNLNKVEKTAYRKLLTKEGIRNYHFPVIILDEGDGFNIDEYKGKAYNFRVRNVYLFPVDNDGFRMPEDANLPEAPAPADKPVVHIVALADAAAGSEYHGVTTPVMEHTLVFPEKTPTGSDDMDLETDGRLALTGQGYVDVIAEGASLYRTDGSLVGVGEGRYYISGGVYVVRCGTAVQKIVVR